MKFSKSMKLASLSSKRIFRSKKDPSTVSRSEQSLSSGSSSSSESYQMKNSGGRTPNSILDLHGSGDLSYVNTVSSAVPYPDFLSAIKKIDTDNDGVVSRGDLEAFFTKIGYNDGVATVSNEKDVASPVISVDELNARFNSVCDPPADTDELRDVFAFFDVDGDGRITAEELQKMLSSLGEDDCSLDDCRQMVAAVGQKDTGFVCFKDFSMMMTVAQR